jgi:hypothetical protein
MKIIYYYQTPTPGLGSVLKDPEVVDVLIVSSIHFGCNSDNTPYIHLNDYPPDDPEQDQIWKETQEASGLGVKIMIMLGGAGGAYDWLFRFFGVYYALLKKTIIEHEQITGIDLDIEQSVKLEDVQMLIRQIRMDFGPNFTITMAPISDSLIFDDSGYTGFSYKDLYLSSEGKEISWFNVQAYGDFTSDTFELMVENEYPANKLVMGMLSEEFSTPDTFKQALNTITEIRAKYPDICGVFDWEYFDAPPGRDPIKWAQLMYQT